MQDIINKIMQGAEVVIKAQSKNDDLISGFVRRLKELRPAFKVNHNIRCGNDNISYLMVRVTLQSSEGNVAGRLQSILKEYESIITQN